MKGGTRHTDIALHPQMCYNQSRKAVFVLYNDNQPKQCVAPLKMLFIGNSATYVNDIPGTLVELAKKAGYSLEADSIVKGGATLSFHASLDTKHGESILKAIRSGYDIVWLQDNGNCVSGEENRQASLKACNVLGTLIRDTGAKVGIYLRPPYGYEKWGLSPFEQCKEFDLHFLRAADELRSLNAYVNRAFAFAIRDTEYDLWGKDHAHTSSYGAYLAVCVFFATIFHTSAGVLDASDLPLEDTRALQEIADKVALNQEIPW